MSDTFGGITIPVGVTTPAGDPMLGKIGAFIQAVANNYVATAYDATKMGAGMPTEQPIATVFAGVEPERYTFDDRQLPALFVYRKRLEFAQRTQDDEDSSGEVLALLIFPHDDYSHIQKRLSIWNAIARVIAAAFTSGLHPSWVDPDDATPGAASVLESANAIKLSVATSTSAQSYSGAALNGSVGAALMTPRREPTITTSFSAGTYVGPAVCTYLDWADRTKSKSVALASDGGETLGIGEDVKQVISWSLPAQSNTSGSFQFGTNAVVGVGSDLLSQAAIKSVHLVSAELVKHNVEVLSGDDDSKFEIRKYDAIDMRLAVIEDLTVDTSDAGRFYPIDTLPHGVDIDVVQAGFTTSASYPDS